MVIQCKAKCRDVWDRLVSLGLNRYEAWILVGDFNELLSNDEKSGGATRSDSSFWDFRDLVQNCKLREVIYTGNCLSWGAGVRKCGFSVVWTEVLVTVNGSRYSLSQKWSTWRCGHQIIGRS